MDYQPSLDLNNILQQIERHIDPFFGQGEVARYIPALAKEPHDRFGMSIHTIDNQHYTIGDSQHPFSIQSISKLFTLQFLVRNMGEAVWDIIGKEPSGDPFNSLVLLEHEKGIPRNPFINAGALVVIDGMLSCYSDAPDERLLQELRHLAGTQEIDFDHATAESERSTCDVNAALAYLMKSHGRLQHSVDDILDIYCRICSIRMSCSMLARATLHLANAGLSPVTQERILGARDVKRINSIMMTCGSYDSVGRFAYRIGLPLKSGVGGGIVAVVPNKMSLCVWSPALDSSGNSVVGAAALEEFTTLTGTSVF